VAVTWLLLHGRCMQAAALHRAAVGGVVGISGHCRPCKRTFVPCGPPRRCCAHPRRGCCDLAFETVVDVGFALAHGMAVHFPCLGNAPLQPSLALCSSHDSREDSDVVIFVVLQVCPVQSMMACCYGSMLRVCTFG
jgi:hypothetical protein